MENHRDEELVIDNFNTANPMTRAREGTRQTIALRLLWLISVVIILIVLAVGFKFMSVDCAKDLALAVLTPSLSIFAIIVGFFYGESER